MTRMLCRMIVVWAAWLPAAAMPADVSSGPRTRPTRSDVGICMTTVQPPDGTLAAA